MNENQDSYRQIVKATSLFGGVQVFNIFIAIGRSKAIAVLLGPTGMGIAGLLNTTLGLITSITSLGLGTSAVKDISSANSTENHEKIIPLVISFRRLVWATGLLGTLLTLVLSGWLSRITFGNDDYRLAFIWISITLLWNQLSSGQLVLLQGMRKLKYLARANMIGSFLGLVFVLPLYYFYGIDGIVPGIIVTSIVSMVIARFYAGKIKIGHQPVTFRETLNLGKGVLILGFAISLTGMMDQLVAYIIRIYISNTGGVDQVGLYNAGFAIINSYVGLIFTAMSTDYFPALCAKSEDNISCQRTVNHQAEIAILILSPLILMFLVFINWVTIILYSSKFVAINSMIHWAILGIFFKAVGWAIGYIFLAKGAVRIYFYTYVLSSVIMLGTNILGYKYWGLEGLGIAFLVSYFLVLFPGYLIARNKYNITLDSTLIRILLLQLFLAICAFVLVKILSTPYSYLAGIVLIIISCVYSYRELDKRVSIRPYIDRLLKR